jgi:hypothetical protein
MAFVAFQLKRASEATGGFSLLDSKLCLLISLSPRNFTKWFRRLVSVEDFELRVLHLMQQHVHAGEIVGGDVLILPVNFADALRMNVFPHVQQ